MKRIGQLILALLFITACGTSKDKVECVENPKPDCYCTMEYNPVCGCNGKTYSNACMAECAGITQYTSGECK